MAYLPNGTFLANLINETFSANLINETFSANLTNGTFSANLTNETFSSTNWTHPQFPARPDYFEGYHSLLNVRKDNVVWFTLILILKSTFICCGICDILAFHLTLVLLTTLLGYSFVLLARGFVWNFAMICAFVYSGVCVRVRLVPIPTFIFSVTYLCLAPYEFRLPVLCHIEYIVDIFLTIHVGWFIFKFFFEPKRDTEMLIEDLLVVVLVLLIFYAFETFWGTNGFFFMSTVVLYYIRGVFNAFRQREILYLIVMVSSIIYWGYEQYLIHLKRSASIISVGANITHIGANITSIGDNMTNITSVGADMTNTTRVMILQI